MVIFAVIFACTSLFAVILGVGFLLAGNGRAGVVMIAVAAAGWAVVAGSSMLGHKLGRF